MDPIEEKRPLPYRRLLASKRLVALALVMNGIGLALITRTWFRGEMDGMMAGVVCTALGFGLLAVGGYYWGCDNESCS